MNLDVLKEFSKALEDLVDDRLKKIEERLARCEELFVPKTSLGESVNLPEPAGSPSQLPEYSTMKIPDISTLNGLVITGLNLQSDELVLRCEDRQRSIKHDVRGFRFYHNQDCCESVNIISIEGDLMALIGETILEATQDSDSAEYNWPEGWLPRPAWVGSICESATRTVLTFRTKHGTVKIVWLGESNGYYSESVDMEEIDLK